MWPSRKPPPATPARPRPDSRPQKHRARKRPETKGAPHSPPQAHAAGPSPAPGPPLPLRADPRTRTVNTSRPRRIHPRPPPAQGRHPVPAAGAAPAVPKNAAQRALPPLFESPASPDNTRAPPAQDPGKAPVIARTQHARHCPPSGFRKLRPFQGQGGWRVSVPFSPTSPPLRASEVGENSTPTPSHPKTKDKRQKTRTKKRKAKSETLSGTGSSRILRVRTSVVQAACRISRSERHGHRQQHQRACQNVTGRASSTPRGLERHGGTGSRADHPDGSAAHIETVTDPVSNPVPVTVPQPSLTQRLVSDR
jgi:hypothetical protein